MDENAVVHETLPKLNQAVLRDIAALLVESIFFGLFGLVFLAATTSILRNPKVKIVTAAPIALLLAFGTVQFASDITAFRMRLKIIFGNTQPIDIRDRVGVADSDIAPLAAVGDVVFVLSYMVGNAVVCWRVLVLWQWHRVAAGVLGFMYLAVAASGLAQVACVAKSYLHDRNMCTNFERASWVTYIALNVAATAFIALLLKKHHRTMRKVDGPPFSSTDWILGLLSVIGVLNIILSVSSEFFRAGRYAENDYIGTSQKYAGEIFLQALNQIVNLYPTAVVGLTLDFTRLDDTKGSQHEDTGSARNSASVRHSTGVFSQSRRTPWNQVPMVVLDKRKGKQRADLDVLDADIAASQAGGATGSPLPPIRESMDEER